MASGKCCFKLVLVFGVWENAKKRKNMNITIIISTSTLLQHLSAEPFLAETLVYRFVQKC